MITAAQIAALEAAASSWVGTPFCEGTPVKGAGVSCHHVVAEVLFESGLMPRLPIPNGPSNWRGQSRSLIAEWIEQSGLFVEVPLMAPDSCLLTPRRPGDVLGFRLAAIHHAMLQLDRGRVVHSVHGRAVEICTHIPARWEPRLAKIWRLKLLA